MRGWISASWAFAHRACYRAALELAGRGELPPLGLHVLIGPTAPEKMRNSARNIEEERTHPVQIVCGKPS